MQVNGHIMLQHLTGMSRTRHEWEVLLFLLLVYREQVGTVTLLLLKALTLMAA